MECGLGGLSLLDMNIPVQHLETKQTLLTYISQLIDYRIVDGKFYSTISIEMIAIDSLDAILTLIKESRARSPY